MKKNLIVFGLLAALIMAAYSSNADAQRPAHFYPARPTFSTYLLYRQFNATGIPNYYAQVRPATQIRDYEFRSSVAASRLAGRQPLDVRREVAAALESELRQRVTTGIGQPSIPAQFGETIHFFPERRTGRR